MAKEKVSRKELLKKPDEFITFSSRAIAYVNEHSRLFRYIGIVIACLVLIFLGINYYVKYIQKKGQESYSMAYHLIVKNMGLEKNQEELKKSEELFEEVIDKYDISKAARLALPEIAYLKFLQKKYDEAISRYQEFLKKSHGEPYQSLARIALSVCYEEKGDFKNAISTLERIRSGPDDFFKEQAMLSMARIYRLQGDQNRSNEILTEFTEKFKNSPFLPIAEAYLNP